MKGLGYVALLGTLWAAQVFAARPFNTDDARVVDPGGNQIETYVKDQLSTRETEFWFLPARNFGGRLDRFEWTLGGNYFHSPDAGHSDTIIGQVKTLAKPLETNGIGFAFTLGVNALRQHPAPLEETKTRRLLNPYINLISSVSVWDDAIVFHGNLGFIRDNFAHSTETTWGLGAEIRVTSQIFGIAEVYGQTPGKPSHQLGIRYWVVPNRLQTDVTYGWQQDTPEDLRWFTVGLRILWE
jgi:hypothetical protein